MRQHTILEGGYLNTNLCNCFQWFKLMTNLMNTHFINELQKIGLQLIKIRGTLSGRLVVFLEAKI
ncbi:MAG: hypothetical protein WA323_16665 [Candidatus Nitrosopolaris sp.]